MGDPSYQILIAIIIIIIFIIIIYYYYYNYYYCYYDRYIYSVFGKGVMLFINDVIHPSSSSRLIRRAISCTK